MKTYTYELARHPHGKYILAIISPTGFAHYQAYPMTPYFERKIRGIICQFLTLNQDIKWNEIPVKEKIETFTKEAA